MNSINTGRSKKVSALNQICEEENLDKKQSKNLIDIYVVTGKKPIKDDVFKCLENRHSVLQAHQIGERIITRMDEFVEVFVDEMVA